MGRIDDGVTVNPDEASTLRLTIGADQSDAARLLKRIPDEVFDSSDQMMKGLPKRPEWMQE